MDRFERSRGQVFFRNREICKAILFAGRLGPLWLQSPARSRTCPRVCPGHAERTQVAGHSLEAAFHTGSNIRSKDRIERYRNRDYESLAESHHRRSAAGRERQIHVYRLRRVQGRLSLGGVGSAPAGQAVAPTADEAIGLNLFPENYSTLLAVNVKSPRIVPC